MKKGLFSIVLCLTILLSATSVSAQEDAYRKALVEMLDASGSMVAIKTMVPQMIALMQRTYSNVPEDFWKAFGDKLNERAYAQFIDIYVPIYKRQLTLEELKKITAFYKSPVGKKLAAATPVMTAEAMTAGQQLGQQIAQEIVAKLSEEGYIEE